MNSWLSSIVSGIVQHCPFPFQLFALRASRAVLRTAQIPRLKRGGGTKRVFGCLGGAEVGRVELQMRSGTCGAKSEPLPRFRPLTATLVSLLSKFQNNHIVRLKDTGTESGEWTRGTTKWNFATNLVFVQKEITVNEFDVIFTEGTKLQCQRQ
jgi:hypothetical protein